MYSNFQNIFRQRVDWMCKSVEGFHPPQENKNSNSKRTKQATNLPYINSLDDEKKREIFAYKEILLRQIEIVSRILESLIKRFRQK